MKPERGRLNLLSFWLDHDVAVDEDGSDDDHAEEGVRESVKCDPPDGVERGEQIPAVDQFIIHQTGTKTRRKTIEK